jgi:hypothetical protein
MVWLRDETAFTRPGPHHASHRNGPEGTSVSDLVFVALSLGFFAVAVAFAYFCEKVR